MASVKPNTTIKGYQDFVKEVYGINNDRNFNLRDMLSNIERFAMRALKGIRKGDKEKTKINLLISVSWFVSMMNQLHIDLEDAVWNRFPYLCSYCASCPCACKDKKIKKRKRVIIDGSRRPKTFEDFQKMFRKIYPPENRTIEHAGVHLAEEVGELSEAVLAYRGLHEEKDFKNLVLESADLFSCFISVFNSLEVNAIGEISKMFSNNCHVCRNAPCTCNFNNIVNFKS